MTFASAYPVMRKVSVALRPPRRISVSEGVKASLVLRQPGGYSGPWSADETPYMIEPMDMLGSRRHEAVVFVGPARTGKTLGLLDGWVAHCVVNDPGDMLITQMTQDKARDYSKTRIDRAIRHSPALRDMMSVRSQDDNTHDKMFRNGMWLKIGWPSATQLASSDYRRVALTDYDRMPDNIDGEGAAYMLGLKRTQTYLSRGMCMVESSPGRDYDDPDWQQGPGHEGPPTNGIMGIYNTSDRRRWYWKCLDCGEYFEAVPGLELFRTLPSEKELLEIVRTEDIHAYAKRHAFVGCQHCGALIDQKHKTELNSIKTARWVPAGQSVTSDGELIGEPVQSRVAGYWLGGVAAAYQKWDSIIERYLAGLREYVLAGVEETLKTTINTDQGMPYLPMHLKEDTGSDLEDRPALGLERYHVPSWARFLIATVDVQGGEKSRFVCEVRAFGVGLTSCLVDRFSITTTQRGGVDSRVDPAAYTEDWDLLTDKLVNGTYRTSYGKELRVWRTAVDTGGEDGVTPNAYKWLARLRASQQSDRVMLLKGAAAKPDKPVYTGFARDDRGKRIKTMPILMIATDYFKDIVRSSMRRDVEGPNYFYVSDWLPAGYFKELRVETKNKAGKYVNLRKQPNEAFDLWCYALAVCHFLGYGVGGKLKWDEPPQWALPLDQGNSEMIDREERIVRKEQAAAQAKKPVRASKIQTRGGWGSRL